MDGIAQVRSFNRTVTQQIGALENRYLGRKRSLGACRMLFEIGPDGADVRNLRARLSLDSGYASRLLRGLEAEGLIRIQASPADARVRSAILTTAGKKEWAVLNRLSDQVAEQLLDRLSAKQRARVLQAMHEVEECLLTGAVELSVEDPESPAARYCVRSYFDELAERFEAGFDPGKSLPLDAEELRPPRGYFVMATLHGEPVGCGSMKCYPDFGYLKRMWVAQSCRGRGVGKRILAELEDLARKRKLPGVKLETNRSLKEAQEMYRRSGYLEVAPFNEEPYAHHWFEKRLS